VEAGGLLIAVATASVRCVLQRYEQNTLNYVTEKLQSYGDELCLAPLRLARAAGDTRRRREQNYCVERSAHEQSLP
jgi:hypothetical protein